MNRPLLLLLTALVAAPLQAHELLSVSLRLDEAQPGQVTALLKTPLARDGGPAAVVPQFEGGCDAIGEPRVVRQPDVILREWRLLCADGLAGKGLRMHGLDPRTPDAVVIARFADGASATLTLDRHDPAATLQASAERHGPPPALLAYLPIGVEHILLGPDHLLFVLGLMLVVYAAGRGLRALVLALTAFTLAHSLTLALAVLELWTLPPKIVEVLIALSIVALALELTRDARHGSAPSLTRRKPWLVAFVFGLLHGLGFAGALKEVGLPDGARGWALLLFNAGVEIGQLLFVAAVLLAIAVLRRVHRAPLARMSLSFTATLLGGVATYWLLDRLLLWSAAIGGA